MVSRQQCRPGVRVRQDGGGWKQVAPLEGSDTVAGDWFGSSVAISGTTIVVGASEADYGTGRAYVFAKTGAGWKQTAELEASDSSGLDDYFGDSLAISGTTVVVGAWDHARAYVYAKMGTGWKQTAELKGSDTVFGDDFGWSVAISGTTVVVGAPSHANSAGRAYVFTRTGAGWTQAAELKGSDTVANDTFGSSVAISGTTVVVGAPAHAYLDGQAYVLSRTPAGWEQTAELNRSDSWPVGLFGNSVAISGTTIVVGDFGNAFVLAKAGAVWEQVAELQGSNTVANDYFGNSVAISGTTVVVGAPGKPKFPGYPGRAYVFAA
jgi:hypothetical protein